jgi:hypothetical protein
VKKDKRQKARTVDLKGLPTFEDKDPKASVRHDKVLYG